MPASLRAIRPAPRHNRPNDHDVDQSNKLRRYRALLAAAKQRGQGQDRPIRARVALHRRKILPDFTAKHRLQEIEALIDDVIARMAQRTALRRARA